MSAKNLAGPQSAGQIGFQNPVPSLFIKIEWLVRVLCGPAELTRISTFPNFATHSFRRFSSDALSETSDATRSVRAPFGFDLGGSDVDLFGAARSADYIGSGLGQAMGDRPTDARGSADDDGQPGRTNLILKSSYISLFVQLGKRCIGQRYYHFTYYTEIVRTYTFRDSTKIQLLPTFM